MKSKKYNKKKKKEGSNGMDPAMLIPCNYINKSKYLNFLVHNSNGYVRVAEWSTQLADTKSSLNKGCVGSIPTPDVTNFSKNKTWSLLI